MIEGMLWREVSLGILLGARELVVFEAWRKLNVAHGDCLCSCHVNFSYAVMKPAHKKIEKIEQCLRIHPLRGGNLLYITQMNYSLMIQMKKPHFYI